MLVTNQTAQDYWFGPLHLTAGVGQTLTVDDTSATSLYLLDDTVADALNNLYNSGKITVSGQALPFRVRPGRRRSCTEAAHPRGTSMPRRAPPTCDATTRAARTRSTPRRPV